MSSRSPYAVLGVSRSATRPEIRAAYHSLAVRFHPDTGGEPSGDQFIELRQAYELLSHEGNRRAWDDAHANYSQRRHALRFPPELAIDGPAHSSPLDAVLDAFDLVSADFVHEGRGDERLFYDLVLAPDEAAHGGCFSFTVPLRRGPFVDVVELSVLVPPGVSEGRRATLPLGHLGVPRGEVTVTVRIE
jgi:curved DNA-binding protein CbpA